MNLLIRLVINAIALWVAGALIDGITLGTENIPQLLIIALVFGLINAIIRPLLKILAFPFIIITFGLLALVINALMLMLTGAIMDGLTVDGFIPAFLGSIVISVVSTIAGWVLPDGNDK